jgi:LacI family transcriptional regulator
MDRGANTIRLRDVARLAGVSTATVSRVLNECGPTSEAVRGKVLRAARELDYHPNGLARGLRSRRTDTIGLVVPDIQNPFFTSLITGVEHEAASRGWNVILGNTDEDLQREESLVRTLVERKIDGLVLCPVGGPHDYLVRYLERGLPVVAVNREVPGLAVPAVTADNRLGAYEAARHLLAKGFQPLALILGSPGLSTTESRLAGCRQAVAECGLDEGALFVRVGHGRTTAGHKAALECLEARPRPRAILAFNNLMAEAALMAIHMVRVRCPEEVALVGFDDFRSAAALTPSLTVVDQDPTGMGAQAVEALARVIRGETLPEQTLLTPRLLLRASCGCGPGEG